MSCFIVGFLIVRGGDMSWRRRGGVLVEEHRWSMVGCKFISESGGVSLCGEVCH